MQQMTLRLKEIESVILSDPLFKTLTMSSTTAPYLNIRAQEIIRNTIVMKQEQQIKQLQNQLNQVTQQLKVEKQKQQQANIPTFKQNNNQLKNMTELYSNSLKKNTTYLQIITQMKEELKLHEKIEEKSIEQYHFISQKQKEIQEVSIRLHKQIIVNQSLKRDIVEMENQLKELKKQLADIKMNEQQDEERNKIIDAMKQEIRKVKLELKYKNIELEEIKVLRNKFEEQNILLTNILNQQRMSKVQLQKQICQVKTQYQKILIRNKNKQTDDKLKQQQYRIAQSANNLHSTKQQQIQNKLKSLKQQLSNYKYYLQNLKQQTLVLSKQFLLTISSKLNSLDQRYSFVIQSYAHKLSRLSSSHNSKISSIKIDYTQQLLNTKRQLKLCKGELQYKQNKYNQYQQQLESGRQQIIANKISSGKKLVEEISQKLKYQQELFEYKVKGITNNSNNKNNKSSATLRSTELRGTVRKNYKEF